MKNELIAGALRRYRKQEQLSVQDVVFLLKEKNVSVSPKTIYSWENGTTKPDVPTMMLLCSLYHISNLQEVLGISANENMNNENINIETKKDAPMILNQEERHLIEQYRQHPEMREAIQKLLN